MDASDFIRSYYRALREGDPLGTHFSDDANVAKFGVSESLRGPGEVGAALREQTTTTTDWVVDSTDLLVRERESFAWFADHVFLAWTDIEDDRRFEFETRWSGTLDRTDGGWTFVSLHVSTPDSL